MRPLFITGTGTGVGKTFVTAALCYQLTLGGYAVRAIKPVITGYREDDPQLDCATLLRALNLPAEPAAFQAMSPWRCAAALSPHLASAQENLAITLEALTAFCRAQENAAELLLVEGAGGVMTPLNLEHSFLDLIAALRYRPVLVAGSYLGGISHALTAVRAMEAGGAAPHAVVVSASDAGSGLLEATAEAILRFTNGRIPLYTVPYRPGLEPWRHAPPLLDICLR